MLITESLIESLKTANGGWTKRTLAMLGVPWPPLKGWKQRIIGRVLDDDPVAIQPKTPPMPSAERKAKVTEVGQLCRNCQTPVVKRLTKHRQLRPGQTYWFESYFYCPQCGTMYVDEQARRMVGAKETTRHPDRNVAGEVIIDYTNHQGERRMRRIIPTRLWFGATRRHPESQWLLNALDVEQQEQCDFATAGIHAWGPAESDNTGQP